MFTYILELVVHGYHAWRDTIGWKHIPHVGVLGVMVCQCEVSNGSILRKQRRSMIKSGRSVIGVGRGLRFRKFQRIVRIVQCASVGVNGFNMTVKQRLPNGSIATNLTFKRLNLEVLDFDVLLEARLLSSCEVTVGTLKSLSSGME